MQFHVQYLSLFIDFFNWLLLFVNFVCKVYCLLTDFMSYWIPEFPQGDE